MYSRNTAVINLWKVDGALQSPCCITRLTNVPKMVAKAILGMSSGLMRICSYASNISNLESEWGMRYVVANGVLVQKRQHILFHVIILLAKVKDCSQFAILFKNTKHRYGLVYRCGYPPACAGVSADLLSQLFLKCVRALRQPVINLFVGID